MNCVRVYKCEIHVGVPRELYESDNLIMSRALKDAVNFGVLKNSKVYVSNDDPETVILEGANPPSTVRLIEDFSEEELTVALLLARSYVGDDNVSYQVAKRFGKRFTDKLYKKLTEKTVGYNAIEAEDI